MAGSLASDVAASEELGLFLANQPPFEHHTHLMRHGLNPTEVDDSL